MRKFPSSAISFAANPFVVFADLLVTVLLIMILAIVHQSISNSNMINRLAIKSLQKRLISELQGTEAADSIHFSGALRNEFRSGVIRNTIDDGDLQRFWFDGRAFFDFNSVKIKDEGAHTLRQFAAVLGNYQGDRASRGNGLFKYILVEGHADSSEGSAQFIQQLALTRALQATQILRVNATGQGIIPVLMKPCGRGDLDAGNFYFSAEEMQKLSPQERMAMNKRIEIVVVYSGNRALQYYGKAIARPMGTSSPAASPTPPNSPTAAVIPPLSAFPTTAPSVPVVPSYTLSPTPVFHGFR